MTCTIAARRGSERRTQQQRAAAVPAVGVPRVIRASLRDPDCAIQDSYSSLARSVVKVLWWCGAHMS